ncbi:MAG: CIS tube protein [Gemmatimonas sp.]
MADSTRVKAVIVNVDNNDRVECYFNPKEYTFAKSNNWSPDPKAGYNVPQLNFGGGQAATLQMELFFDTYAKTRSGGPCEDVRRAYTDKIWQLMIVDEKLKDKKNKKGRPPKVRFQWGKAWSFNAVITSISQKFTLFDTDGTPVRATLTVSFQQIQDTAELAPQNPTSGGTGGERVWTVTDGDTLAWIAYKEYGDTSRWRQIADANRLTEVRQLAPGTVLVIPNG